MSLREHTGTRPLFYSPWHRPGSIGRYMPLHEANRLAMIDIDAAEYCMDCYDPLLLLETALDTERSRSRKCSGVTDNLARRAGIQSATLLYQLDRSRFLPDSDDYPSGIHDISGFRLKRNYPRPDREWFERSPQEIATWLLNIRLRHREEGCSRTPRTRTVRFPVDDPHRAAWIVSKQFNDKYLIDFAKAMMGISL